MKVFAWLATWKRCWTADRLAHRELPHLDRCPFCDQEDEDINHILVSCAFTKDWFHALQLIGMETVSPMPQAASFREWWRTAGRRISANKRKGFNSMVLFIILEIWKHRNQCVFEAQQPWIPVLLWAIREEARFWTMAGAKKLPC